MKTELSQDAIIEVVITKGDKVKVQTMTFGQYLKMKKHKGFYYQSFQVGFHSYKQNV